LYAGILKKKGNRQVFTFDTSVEAAAPGQIAVFYEGENVVGCGEIRFK
jgi:tRNA U34 2-thiouridine synthase MnmA/TrmU